jgi:hypothetical protein
MSTIVDRTCYFCGGEGGAPLKCCSLISWKQQICILPATLWSVPLEQSKLVNFRKIYVSSTPPTSPDLVGNDLIVLPDNCMLIYTGVCQMHSSASLSRWHARGGATDDVLYWQAWSGFNPYLPYFMFCWPHLDIFIQRETQLDVQFIYSIFRQTLLHVSGVSTAHHQEVHCTDITIGTCCSF